MPSINSSQAVKYITTHKRANNNIITATETLGLGCLFGDTK